MSKPTFARKTFYVRKQNLWLLQAIKAVLKECDEVGVRATDSDVIASALTEYLQKYKKCDVVEKPKAIVNTELKKTVTCPTEKSWLFERIEQLVKIKQATGIHTSFSYEVCSLLQAALTSDTELAKINRALMKNFKGTL